jgi:hypothetical protein
MKKVCQHTKLMTNFETFYLTSNASIFLIPYTNYFKK